LECNEGESLKEGRRSKTGSKETSIEAEAFTSSIPTGLLICMILETEVWEVLEEQ
jgi:hypothetical protein